MYIFHVLVQLKNQSIFTVYLCNEWMFYRLNFLTFQWKKGRLKGGEEEAGKKAQGGRDEVEVCDSITHNVQFDANCQMIS